MSRPAAVIADDEPLLRERLRSHLARLWPELDVVAEARNGREAVEAFAFHAPQIVFLDVHMPGLNGVEAARQIRAIAGEGVAPVQPLLVFVTAYEQYAVTAFEQGAIDYLVKPFEPQRLAETVERLRDRLAARAPVASGDEGVDAVIAALAARLAPAAPTAQKLQWIRASVGTAVKLIPVEQVAYLRADDKYTLVAWEGGEALIRKTIRELADELDPERFAQVHRSVIVNLAHVLQVNRGSGDNAELQLRGRRETLPVSRSYLHLFRQM